MHLNNDAEKGEDEKKNFFFLLLQQLFFIRLWTWSKEGHARAKATGCAGCFFAAHAGGGVGLGSWGLGLLLLTISD